MLKYEIKEFFYFCVRFIIKHIEIKISHEVHCFVTLLDFKLFERTCFKKFLNCFILPAGGLYEVVIITFFVVLLMISIESDSPSSVQVERSSPCFII